MFLQLYEFFLSLIRPICDVLKKFILFDNFNYFDLLICIILFSLVIKIINFIKGAE